MKIYNCQNLFITHTGHRYNFFFLEIFQLYKRVWVLHLTFQSVFYIFSMESCWFENQHKHFESSRILYSRPSITIQFKGQMNLCSRSIWFSSCQMLNIDDSYKRIKKKKKETVRKKKTRQIQYLSRNNKLVQAVYEFEYLIWTITRFGHTSIYHTNTISFHFKFHITNTITKKTIHTQIYELTI